MKVRIEFPQDIAKDKAEEAKNWEPGQPMIWEAQDYNTIEKIYKEGKHVVIKTRHTEVWLDENEVAQIKDL